MILPEFKGRIAGYWNKNEWGKRWHQEHRDSPEKSNLLDPKNSDALLAHAMEVLGADYLYGGWMEDRSVIWAESYLKAEQRFLHLGLDIWAPAGSAVAVDHAGTILEISDDLSEGGWGTRVMFSLEDEPVVLLYGHLSPRVLYKKGTRLAPGTVFATLGTPEENGGWAPHVHVQAMGGKSYAYFRTRPDKLDGYGLAKNLRGLARQFPDPIRFIELK